MKKSFVAVCLLMSVGIVSVTLLLGTGTLMAAAAPAQPSATDLTEGKTIFITKCSLCHGPTGDGKGPNSATLNPPPANFNNPKMWKGDMAKQIQNVVTNGKGMMPPQNLKPEEARAVVAYVTQTFKPKTTK